MLTFTGETSETWHVCRAHDRLLKIAAVRSRVQAAPAVDAPVTFKCRDCDQVLDEVNQPCPICGSGDRVITAGDRGVAHEAVRLRVKQGEKGRWIVQINAGDNYTRDLSAWGHRELTINREQNQYSEVIELYEGSSIVSTAKLTDHLG
ncbi:hypothetical protein [Streptomyces sp. BPTC-684]|uniref:hypothetical protein n=1 Tax=Streptomyces sp. BPTC-684 TaxID=3043734 RepID=UPI0024B135A3|nr:hypothetical protein [Streptomyces sp. BPTC-684]WHM41110.1 hypothetical protein QIY60_32470 [Streptomyces sp. BPTC-684]